MKRHGKPEPADVTPFSARYHGSRDFDNLDEIYKNYNPEEEYWGIVGKPTGMFRTPEEDGEALDYWKFNNWQIADTVAFFIKKAREVISEDTELGACFGYMTDIGKFYRASTGASGI